MKWLGPNSSEHAKRIREVNITQPTRGLRLIWERLQQCYGSAEVIEDALFKRLDAFPKVTTRDYGKLREWVNIGSQYNQPRFLILWTLFVAKLRQETTQVLTLTYPL